MDDPNSQNKYAGQNLAGTDAVSSYAQRKGMSELTKKKHEKMKVLIQKSTKVRQKAKNKPKVSQKIMKNLISMLLMIRRQMTPISIKFYINDQRSTRHQMGVVVPPFFLNSINKTNPTFFILITH